MENCLKSTRNCLITVFYEYPKKFSETLDKKLQALVRRFTNKQNIDDQVEENNGDISNE